MKLELIKISFLIFYKIFLFNFINLCKYVFNQNTSDRIDLLKDISNLLINYNIVYIKFFQQLCLEKELLYENEENYLLNFTDHVPFKDSEIDTDYLNSMCNKYNIKLKSDNPLSSGIIAVVYKGTININNKTEDIIIKLKKIGIEERYISAFENLLLISKLLNYFPLINNFNIEKILKDTEYNILIQTDFSNEVKNLIDYNKCITDYPEIISPLPIKKITDDYKNCIVMSDISGMTIRDVLKLDKTDKDKFGRLLTKLGILGVVFFGIVNCDFHAGNAFFYKDVSDNLPYRVGIIDFGICSRCSPDNMQAYFTFFFNVLSKKEYSKFRDIIHVFIHDKEAYFNLSENNKTLLLDEFNEHLRFMHKNKQNIDAMFFFKIGRTFKKFNIYFSKEFNIIITTMNAVNSLGKSLTDNVNVVISDICEDFNKLENTLKIH